MPGKSEVYTWRLSPSMKASLEEAARNSNRSVAKLLDEIVGDRLEAIGLESEAEKDNQRRLHARAAAFSGRFSSERGRSEHAKARDRARLTQDRPRVP